MLNISCLSSLSRLTRRLGALALLAASVGTAQAQSPLPLAPVSARTNVPEASGYGILYQLDAPNAANFNTTGVTYTTNNSALALANPARVAYYLELTNSATSATTYVWASMANFATTLTQLGIPNPSTNNVSFHRNVSSLNVASNVTGVTTGTNLGIGRIEMWPSDYATNNIDGVAGASSSTYDFGDEPVSGNYGSFQVHNVTAGQTVLAYNNWGSNGGNSDIGIGSNAGTGQPDWTFRNNAGNYSVKRITILITATPTLTTLSPNSGPVGTSVTLTGTNLAGTTAVGFNGTTATSFTVVSATTVTAIVPAGTTTGPVTVTTPGGTSNTLTFNVTCPLPTAIAQNQTVALSTTGSGTLAATAVNNASTPTNCGNLTYQVQKVVYGQVNEGQTLTLTAPAGAVFTAVTFASYGTPTGSNGNYVLGSCNGTNSQSVVAGYVVGNNTASIPATNTVFGDPCYGTSKSLAVQAVYTTLAPQVSYTCADVAGPNYVLLTVTDAANNKSTATAQVTVTAPTAATITGISPTLGSVGQTITVTGTNLGAATGLTVNGTAAAISSNTGTSFTFVVPSGATATGNVVVSAPCTPASIAFSVVGDLTVSTTTTIPAGTYNTITVTGTGNGTLSGDVTVNTGLVIQDGGILNDRCNLITGSGTFTLAAGGTLAICRARGILAVGDPQGNIGLVRVTGGRSFSSDANYIYNGSDVTGSGLPSQVRNLSIVSPTSVGLTQSISIAQVLTLSNTGNLTLGGQTLTLLSSATGTALVVNSGSGVVIGAGGTVQRYLDPSMNTGLGYRHYSAPVGGTTVADLTTTGFSPVLTSTYNGSATPGTTTPFPTVFAYDQARVASAVNNFTAFDKGYVVPASTGTPLAVGQGYAVNIDASQLVDFVGTLNTGDKAVSLARNSGATAADAGWALVGNPYPAPIDFSLIAAGDRTGLDGSFYVFESNSQYTGTYRTTVNGIGSSNYIGSSQGFFVRVSNGQTAGSLTFRNAQRLVSYNNQVPVRRSTTTRPLVQLELRAASGLTDVLYAYAEAGATPAFDAQYDAVKMPNSTGLNLASLSANAQALAIDGRPAFTAATVLPLTVGVPAAGAYSLTAAALDNLPAGLDAFLTDYATGQTVNLSQQPTYPFSVTTAQAAALLTNRFALTFAARSVLATTTALTAAEVTLYPNPTHAAFTVLVPAVAGATQVQGTLLNALGQVVRHQSAALPAAGARLVVETADLATGIYTLRLQVGTTTLTKRVVIQ